MAIRGAPRENKRAAVAEVVTRETTIHLRKYVRDMQPKKCAPRAVKVIRQAALRLMGTEDVRIDPKLNKALWAHGIKGVPCRIRVRFARKRSDVENAKHKLYTQASYVAVASFKGLQTESIDE